MKIVKFLGIAGLIFLLSSCGYYSCPTYTDAELKESETSKC